VLEKALDIPKNCVHLSKNRTHIQHNKMQIVTGNKYRSVAGYPVVGHFLTQEYKKFKFNISLEIWGKYNPNTSIYSLDSG